MSAAARSEFAISLKDETSGSARTAGQALVDLRSQIDADMKALRQMQAAMRALKGGTVTNVAAFRELRDRIAAQKASISSAQARFIELGGTFGDVAKSAEGTTSGLGSILSVAERMPGPLGSLVGRVSSLSSLLAGGAIAAGILAIVAALTALAAAAAAATAALLRYGIAQSDARRSELLHLEGLTMIRRMYGLAAGSATELQQAIDRASASSALGRSQIGGYAQMLYRAGLRGDGLSEALDAASVAGSALGERWGRRMAGMAAGIARAGGDVHAFAERVRSQFGGLAARQALSLGVQIEKLHENINRLFDGLELEGFLRGLHEITDLFSQNTASGRALKAIFEGLFQPMLGALGTLAPLARRFFQGLVIGALLVTIALQRLGGWMRRTFGDSEILGGMTAQRLALLAGVVAIGALTIGLVAAGAAAAMLVVSIAMIAAPFVAAVAAVGALGVAIGAAIATIQATDWSALGQRIIDGLVGGIRSGIARVTSAVRDVATAAQSALRTALGIHSPSRVFASLGLQVSRGLEEGVDSGAGGVDRAVGDVVQVPSAPGAGPRRSPAASSARSITIEELHVHGASGEPSDIAEAIYRELARLLEGSSIEMGAVT